MRQIVQQRAIWERCVSICALVCTLTFLSGPTKASAQIDYLDDDSYLAESVAIAPDPLEPLNRFFFQFNDVFYIWILEPVATGYGKVVPADIRGCVGNFFSNLGEPVRAANCLLQGRFRDAGLALSRFVINTVCGVFGLADAAGEVFDIQPLHATLGQTFAVWGIGDGIYLVVPFLGPSTLRELPGTVLDGVAETAYSPWEDETLLTLGLYGVRAVNTASFHLGEYEDLKSMSFDPYIAFRDGYFQLRNKQRSSSAVNKQN
ncbi:MAG: VacJ family lipoprotein [Desulfobulbus sp.]|jgi:phospholipid-binding lipoprotein MlaA